MNEFFLTMLRLARSMISAWSRDPQFRSLVVLVIVTLLGGTIFYSTVEGGDLAPTTTIGKLFTVIYIFGNRHYLGVHRYRSEGDLKPPDKGTR